MERAIVKAALEYREKFNFSVIPLSGTSKRPLLPWKEFQDRRAEPDEIVSWFEKWPSAMIGIVTGKISDDFVLDIDGPEGEKAIEPWLPESLVTPVAMSPRGGKHYHFLNPQEDITIKAGLFPQVDYRGNGGYIAVPPSRNAQGKEYKWVIPISEVPRAPLPGALIEYIIKHGFNIREPSKVTSQQVTEVTTSHKMFEYGTRDEDLFRVANTMTKGGAHPSEISQVLERLIFSWGENPDQKWIETKIQSALKRAERREFNITEDLRKWIEATEGHWKVTEYYTESQIVTKEQKHAVIVALKRLQEEGIVRKYGDQRGVYTKGTKEEKIDFLNADDREFKISWPFEIESLVKLYPRSVVIIAGEPNAGKSAFLLNTALLNMDRHKVYYFSSEMGDIELKVRLKLFEFPLKNWKVEFISKAQGFADSIRPDDINIIDFLEIYKEFYEVGGFIREIYDKLNKGIAIIALQKNRGTELGLGGMRAMEKARLYIAMEPGVLKIMKGKNWASDTNPERLERRFKLWHGAKFIYQSEWERGK